MGLFASIFGSSSDTYVDKRGYERHKSSSKLVHRKQAEERIGRKLRKGEVVHHIDRNKRNNSKKNLWVFSSQEEHDKVHKRDAKKFGKKASYKGFNKKKKRWWE
jgi:hypothetical protein